MPSRQLDEEAIFHVARHLNEAAPRAAYLDQICAGDQALRQRVEALLRVHEGEQEFLKSVPVQEPTVAYKPGNECAGDEIGRYKLREKLGEGGFGSVWAAEQSAPVRRKVALKIIKPGMDSRDVVARFEAERQALALMDHPNIARVFDGGTTPQGRPYFVMELIRGVPITEYCDENRLTVDDRLRLFVDVCKAVQHAHQKGIIHRDIKPSNVLVTLHDNAPVPKVIDFGVAKALSQQLTDKTIYTRVHAAVGTLAYMSPEQAALTNQDIDTRADVYGLGVLLYELLTGTTPIDSKRLERAALDEAIRIIREEEAPKASVKLSGLGATATTVSAKRQTDPNGLQKLVRGELDWILLKALEKDRTRRYETATSLADDIRRLLAHEVVLAKPPSTAYRARKFIARNKQLCVGISAVVLSLLAGLAGSVWFAVDADQQRFQALRDQRKAEEQQARADSTIDRIRILMLDDALMLAMNGDIDRAQQVLDDAQSTGIAISAHWRHIVLGQAYGWRGDYAAAAAEYRKAPESYAARACLAMDPLAQWGSWVQSAETVFADEPKEPEDYMFRANVEQWFDSRHALHWLENVQEWKNTRYCNHIIAATLANDSLINHTRGQAHKALLEAEGLRARSRDNQVVLVTHLFCIMAAIHEADREKNQRDMDDLIRRARAVIKELEPTRQTYFVGRTRAWFFGDFGDPQELLDEWTTRLHGDPKGGDAFQATACFTQYGSEDELLRIVDPAKLTPYDSIAQAFLWASKMEHRDKIVPTCLRAVEREGTPEVAGKALEALLYSGHFSEARQLAAKLLKEHDRQLRDDLELILKFIVNPVEPESFCKQWDQRRIPQLLSNSNYWVGLVNFALGKKNIARQYFERCIAARVFHADWYLWSRAIVARMDADREWPDWIASRDEK